MAISFVDQTTIWGPSTGGETSSGSANTTGATLLVLSISYDPAGVPGTPVDSKGNTWTLIDTATDGVSSHGACRIYYAQSPVVGSGHTISAPGVPSVSNLVAFSGTNTTGQLNTHSNANSGGVGVTSIGATNTPSGNNELIVSVLGMAGGNAVTPAPSVDSGFSLFGAINLITDGVTTGWAYAVIVQTTGGAVTPTWSWSVADYANTVTASFLPSGAGATAVVWGAVPTSGAVNTASTNWSVGVDTTPITGTLVVTPASNHAGTFSPSTLSLTTGSPSGTFTFTPTVSGAHTISLTNNGGLTNPSTKSYTVQPAVTLTLVASPTDATPQANLTNLHWFWRDVTDQDSAATPVNHGNTMSTNASGVSTVNLPNSALTGLAAQSGTLVWTNAAGTSGGIAIVAVS